LRFWGNSYGVCYTGVLVVPPVKTGGYLRGTPPGFDVVLSLVYYIGPGTSKCIWGILQGTLGGGG